MYHQDQNSPFYGGYAGGSSPWRVGLKSQEMLMKVETYKTAGNTIELQIWTVLLFINYKVVLQNKSFLINCHFTKQDMLINNWFSIQKPDCGQTLVFAVFISSADSFWILVHFYLIKVEILLWILLKNRL